MCCGGPECNTEVLIVVVVVVVVVVVLVVVVVVVVVKRNGNVVLLRTILCSIELEVSNLMLFNQSACRSCTVISG